MADVPDDAVGGAVEGPVQGDREFDHPEVGAEMTAGARDRLDQKEADLLAELD